MMTRCRHRTSILFLFKRSCFSNPNAKHLDRISGLELPRVPHRPAGCLGDRAALLTFSPGFSTSGLRLRAHSSADSGWQISWMDFCPEEGSDRGVPPVLMALLCSDRAAVFISLPHEPNRGAKHLSADGHRAEPELHRSADTQHFRKTKNSISFQIKTRVFRLKILKYS